MSELDHHSDEMTQSDLAVTTALKALIDIVLSARIAEPKAFTLRLQPIMETYAQQGDLKAAELLRLLLVFANDPTRAANREVRQKLRESPPAGSA